MLVMIPNQPLQHRPRGSLCLSQFGLQLLPLPATGQIPRRNAPCKRLKPAIAVPYIWVEPPYRRRDPLLVEARQVRLVKFPWLLPVIVDDGIVQKLFDGREESRKLKVDEAGDAGWLA